ncbi:50S ribosomal protein L11 methyltransferase [Helicobacter sp. 23-1045]
MTERNGHYFEVCIALDSAEFSEIFTSEIMDFCGEAVEIADNKIIVRTSKDRDFINALLVHLSDFGANLKAIWQKNVTFSHSIEKKQNRDWIEEYKKGIQAIRCGRFYICPPWCEGNSSLESRNSLSGNHSADLANRLKAHRTQSPLSLCRFAKNYESTTAIPSVVDSAKIAESTTDSSLRENERSEFSWQSTKKLNPCEAPKTRPLRGAKNREQASSSASADFLLEAEKRGSPPKSEKAAAFWRVGGAGRGVQPFLRKKTSESNPKNGENIADSAIRAKNAESNIESQNLNLDGCFASLTNPMDCHELFRNSRNDKTSAESNTKNTHPLAPSAMEGESVVSLRARVVEQKADSANRIKIAESNLILQNLNAESHTAHNLQSNNRRDCGGNLDKETSALPCFVFVKNFGVETGLESANTPKFFTSAKGAPKSELQDAKLINIILEPSLAFGTGHHSSTFMCIQAIESLGENGDLKNKMLLDFGCGSGILALCAYKLGAKVDLCDIDELAIAESKKNFRNNNATISHIWQGEIHRESKGDIAQKSAKYDIITANIIASVLVEQKENIASALKYGGIAILSGILDIYKDEVLARFGDFEVLNIAQKDEWICIMLRKF